MTDQRTWRIIDVLNWSRKDLEARGVDRARLDSEVLLGHALGLRRLDLYTNFDRPLSPDELASFRQLITRRRKREPVAHITGKKEFYSLDFHISPDVLIPRPETELIVERVLAEFNEAATPMIADVGTGSGCLAITLAHHLKHAQVWASDISPRAIEIARSNAQIHGASVNFVQGDLLAAFPAELFFDCIVSNPPYIRSDLIENLQPEVQLEPRLALDGGNDGLDILRRLIAECVERLQTNGLFLYEIGADQGTAARTLVEETKRFSDIAVVQDLAKKDRLVLARRNG